MAGIAAASNSNGSLDKHKLKVGKGHPPPRQEDDTWGTQHLKATVTLLCSGARSGDGTFFSDPTCLRSAVAALAAAAGNQSSADEPAIKLGQGLSIPRRSSLADAKSAQQTAGARQLSQASACVHARDAMPLQPASKQCAIETR